jgi:hypothetical protein
MVERDAYAAQLADLRRYQGGRIAGQSRVRVSERVQVRVRVRDVRCYQGGRMAGHPKGPDINPDRTQAEALVAL